MDSLINRILDLGIDLSTRNAVKSALNLLELDEGLADEIYIDIKNKLNKDRFVRVPFNERILFLPQCLRHSKECKAEMSDKGYLCKDCGKCIISKIKKEAERLGYKVFIVLGGSMVSKMVIKYKPKAVVGIACYIELEQGIQMTTKLNIPTQCVPLARTGCKDTKVNIKAVMGVIKQHDDPLTQEKQP